MHLCSTGKIKFILDEVAVIDEIQMIKDSQRGWAWTRALLGLVADEIHICGEAAAINLVKDIASSCSEELEVILSFNVILFLINFIHLFIMIFIILKTF